MKTETAHRKSGHGNSISDLALSASMVSLQIARVFAQHASPKQGRHVRARVCRVVAKVWHRLPKTRRIWNQAERLCRTHDYIWSRTGGRSEVDLVSQVSKVLTRATQKYFLYFLPFISWCCSYRCILRFFDSVMLQLFGGWLTTNFSP